MAANPTDYGYVCCFCWKTIEPVEPDPVQLAIPLPEGGSQCIFTHVACLRRLLHPMIQLHPDLWDPEEP
jgi:hypothetical protein